MCSVARDYLLLIAWGFCGVLQVVACNSGLHGLCLFSDRKKGYLIGSAITAGAFVWFFASGNRNIEGHITGVQGAQQFGLFLAGVTLSIAITACIVSVLNVTSAPKAQGPEYGLEQIRKTTYLQAFLGYFRRGG